MVMLIAVCGLVANSMVMRGSSMTVWGIVRLWGKRLTGLVVLYHSLNPVALGVVHVIQVHPFIMFFFIALPACLELESAMEPPRIDKLLNDEFIFIINLYW